MSIKTGHYLEKQLDIRKLIETRTDISILTRILLNKQQRILFANQNARSIVEYENDLGDDDQDDDDTKKDHLDKSLFYPGLVSKETIRLADSQSREKSSLKYFGILIDYKIESEIDRKLLLGVWNDLLPENNLSTTFKELAHSSTKLPFSQISMKSQQEN